MMYTIFRYDCPNYDVGVPCSGDGDPVLYAGDDPALRLQYDGLHYLEAQGLLRGWLGHIYELLRRTLGLGSTQRVWRHPSVQHGTSNDIPYGCPQSIRLR